MNIFVRFDKKCPVKFKFRDSFKEFIRQCVIAQYRILIKRKRIYIDKILQPFKLNSNEIVNELDNLVKVSGVHDGFRIYLSPMVEIKNMNLLAVLKAIDFGSELTGLPKPLFYPVLKYIKQNITRYYLKYLGF